MSKVGFTTLLNRDDSVLSPHFGMAKWVMIHDSNSGETSFEQNTDLNGRAVVDILARAGCSDTVFKQIGLGALRKLQRAGIRGWLAPESVPVPQLLERLSRGELSPAEGHAHDAERTGRTGCDAGHAQSGSPQKGSAKSSCCCDHNRPWSPD